MRLRQKVSVAVVKEEKKGGVNGGDTWKVEEWLKLEGIGVKFVNLVKKEFGIRMRQRNLELEW